MNQFTIVIPFFNGQQYLERLLNSIPESIPVVLIDDQSDRPPNVEKPNVSVLRLPQKGYFTGAVNSGIEACKTDVLIVNQDTYFTGNGWLNFIDQHKKEYGIFGEQAGTHPAWPNRYVHGTWMYIRRDVIKKVGLMDAKNFPHWGSTCDYQTRTCRNGFKALPVAHVPDFVHLRQGSYGSATEQVLERGDSRGNLIKTPPIISVIITCYNYGRYLADAVNSLIGGKTSLGKTDGQTFQGFEIIIVDDGSTDGSVEIGRKLANPWLGIHFVAQKNQGSAVAMNTGIQASHARNGHFIAPLDGDDMMKPERLQRMMDTYQANPRNLIYDNIQYFAHGQEGVVVNWETLKRYDTLDLGGYNFEEILYKNTLHKGLLYPRQVWEEVGGYPAIMNQGREDWAFNVGAGLKGWCGVNTRAFEYLYRREGQNRTLRNTNPAWRKRFLEQLETLYPKVYNEGERPMGCCPGKKSKSGKEGKGAGVMGKRELPGKQGMVILEYAGVNAGDLTWRGPVTQAVYYLGGVRREGYVDIRDARGDPTKNVKGMLDIEEKGRKVFQEKKQVKPLPSVKKSVPPNEPPRPVIEAWKDTVAETKFAVTGLADLSVTVIKEKLPMLSVDELEMALQQEREGRGRTTALRAIEEALSEHLA